MKKLKKYLFFGLLILAVIITGINYFVNPFQGYFVVEEEDQEVVETETEDTDVVSMTKQEILEALSVEERVAQLIAYPLVVDNEPEEDGLMKKLFDDEEEEATASAINELRLDLLSPGFITIFGTEIASESAKQKIIEVRNLYKDNLLSPRIAVDHEGGSVQRLSGEGYTVLPSWSEMCQMDGEEMKLLLRKSAIELRNSGVDIVLAPVLDVGNSSVLKDRICANSYPLTAERSLYFTNIFDSVGLLPVVKHFPGIGNVDKDLHTAFDFTEVLNNDVKLYKYIIENSTRVAAMVSHAGVVSQDSQVPCSLSKDCVNELKTAYPSILVFSDALEMEAASYNKENVTEPKDLVRVASEAVWAGNEVLIFGQSVSAHNIKDVIFNLSQEYRNDSNFKDLVDKAVLKIVDYKYLRPQI